MKEFLIMLLRSLNNIEVKGKDNMDVLLGCMMAIENKIVEINEERNKDDVIIEEAQNGR